MPLIIIIALIVGALIWWYKSEHSSSLNEKAYLRGRGYNTDEREVRGPIPLDARVRSLIDSLDDVTPYARQRAAEEIALMCDEGRRDARFFAPLIAALDDHSAGVRGAAVVALEKLGDNRAEVHLKRVADSDDSIHVRAIARKAAERMSAVPS